MRTLDSSLSEELLLPPDADGKEAIAGIAVSVHPLPLRNSHFEPPGHLACRSFRLKLLGCKGRAPKAGVPPGPDGQRVLGQRTTRANGAKPIRWSSEAGRWHQA